MSSPPEIPTDARPSDADAETLLVVYDGECPFCSAYARLLRLRDSVGKVEMVDARSGRPKTRALIAQGVQPDKGIVVRWRGDVYQGAEALNLLSLLSTSSDRFNRLTVLLFRNRTLARLLYPFLYTARNLALFLLGRKRI